MPSPAVCSFPVKPPRRPSQAPLEVFALPSFRCWSWRCPGCTLLLAKDARRIISTGFWEAIGRGLPVVLLTITEGSHPRLVHDSSKGVTALLKRLRARFNPELRWVGVLEWQSRGAPHWHLVIAGLAYCRTVSARSGRPYPGHMKGEFPFEIRKEADLRPLILRYGFGPVFDVHAINDWQLEAPPPDSYLVKYLTKAEQMAFLPKRARPFRSSVGRYAWAPGMNLTSLRRSAADAAKVRGKT